MIKRFLQHLHEAMLLRPGRALRRNVAYYWYIRDRRYWFALLIATTLLLLFGLAIQHSVQARTELQEVTCLALNVYHEARGEPLEGQYAVAQVTMNRVRSRYYPKSICEVVYQKNWDTIRGREVAAFSWTLHEEPSPADDESWQRAWQVAHDVYARPDDYHRLLSKALFYHALRVEPRWAQEKKEVATIGEHVFYQ